MAMLNEVLTLLKPWLPWLAGLSLTSIVLVAVAIPWLVLRLPASYFARRERSVFPWRRRHPLVYVPLRVLKNLVALALLVIGFALLFLPGQGVLTMVVGALLLDFPGKYQIERRLVAQPRILAALNGIRLKAGRPPFELENGGVPPRCGGV